MALQKHQHVGDIMTCSASHYNTQTIVHLYWGATALFAIQHQLVGDHTAYSTSDGGTKFTTPPVTEAPALLEQRYAGQLTICNKHI